MLRQIGFTVAMAGWLMVVWMSTPATTQTGAGAPNVAAFLQVDRCYRLTFAIAGAPNWKVLQVLDGTWIKAEVDAGPAAARREAVWVNTAQIVTAREATCSQ